MTSCNNYHNTDVAAREFSGARPGGDGRLFSVSYPEDLQPVLGGKKSYEMINDSNVSHWRVTSGVVA